MAVRRRLIELLALESVWIDNDSSIFLVPENAARGVSVTLRLGSFINFHNVLDDEMSKKYFHMNHSDNYQFQLYVTIKAWQWIELLKQGSSFYSRPKSSW